jgi:hypothetical protein
MKYGRTPLQKSYIIFDFQLIEVKGGGLFLNTSSTLSSNCVSFQFPLNSSPSSIIVLNARAA